MADSPLAPAADMQAGWLAALREHPQSARDLAVTLGYSTSRSNVAVLRGELERLERRGEVQRTRTRIGRPWIWEVPATAEEEGPQ